MTDSVYWGSNVLLSVAIIVIALVTATWPLLGLGILMLAFSMWTLREKRAEEASAGSDTRSPEAVREAVLTMVLVVLAGVVLFAVVLDSSPDKPTLVLIAVAAVVACRFVARLIMRVLPGQRNADRRSD